MGKSKSSSISRSIGRLKNLFKAEEDKKDLTHSSHSKSRVSKKKDTKKEVKKYNSAGSKDPDAEEPPSSVTLTKAKSKELSSLTSDRGVNSTQPSNAKILNVKKKSGDKGLGEEKSNSEKEKGKMGSITEEKDKKESDVLEKPKDDKKKKGQDCDRKGGAKPAQAETHGVKNKLRWKIDVEPVDVNGEQKIAEIREKIKELKKKYKKQKKENNKDKKGENSGENSDEDKDDEDISLCARILQITRLNKIIEKETLAPDQDILRNFCRAGSEEEKAEVMIEKLATTILGSIVVKNEFCRTPIVPGQLRIFAVEEKTSKFPMMALLIIRKDLLYISWSKGAELNDLMSDPTWAHMTAKK